MILEFIKRGAVHFVPMPAALDSKRCPLGENRQTLYHLIA